MNHTNIILPLSNTSSIELPSAEPGEAGPYTLIGTAHAKPGMADALEKRLLSLVAPTRTEEGALEYHVHRDRADSRRFFFYEAWQSAEHLQAHLAQPYIQAFLADRMTYLAEDMTIHWVAMRSPYPKLILY